MALGRAVEVGCWFVIIIAADVGRAQPGGLHGPPGHSEGRRNRPIEAQHKASVSQCTLLPVMLRYYLFAVYTDISVY